MSYKFFQNKECPYFPCHEIGEDDMNCLFCYCPLYALKDKCGGDFLYLESGVKSCENCTVPHRGEAAWDSINHKITEIIALGKKED